MSKPRVKAFTATKTPNSSRRAPATLGSLLVSARTKTARASGVAVDADTWLCAVGSRIAERAQPGSAQGGVLSVNVASAVWAQELSLLSTDILHKLRRAGYEFTALRFRVAESARRARSQANVPSVSKAPLPNELASRLATLDDPALRSAIEDAAAFSLGLREQRQQKATRTSNAANNMPPAKAAATSTRRDARAPRSAERESARSGRSAAELRGAARRNREDPED
jgi:hypothetical protein